MELINVDGKKTALINMFIDPEHGFQTLGLSEQEGGVLYVPQGEEVSPIMGEIIEKSCGSIFVIAQDYHPRTHISFMVNHPGVMEDRIEKFKDFLINHGQDIPEDADELYTQAQQPVHFLNGFDQAPEAFPFAEIVLNKDRDIAGLKELDGRIRLVEVETTNGSTPDEGDRGRISKVLDQYADKTFDEYIADGEILSTQTLWTTHGVQGTKSCLYPDEMNLPEGLIKKLEGDLMSRTIFYHDAKSGNDFYIVRKGTNSEIDSYGIGVENDGKTFTPAFDVFSDISDALKAKGCEKVIINGGGLAANFCTEFSLNNTDDFLAGFFKMKNIGVDIRYVPEISRGIPIPGGSEVPFSLQGTAGRLAQRGITETTVKDILDLQPQTQPNQGLSTVFPSPTIG